MYDRRDMYDRRERLPRDSVRTPGEWKEGAGEPPTGVQWWSGRRDEATVEGVREVGGRREDSSSGLYCRDK